MKILIYDNQQAYYELIKMNFPRGYKFSLFNSEENENTGKEYDMLMFFLYDEIELLEFIKLYSETIPVVLGLHNMNNMKGIKVEGNIYYLHLDKFKEEIIEEVKNLLEKIQNS